MQLTVNTNVIQQMVARSMKGAGNNKMLPLTGFMAIELDDGTLSLITTDGTNFLYIRQACVEGDDFYVVVPADLFSKLISKLTCENVTLNLTGNALAVKGNGKYNIDLPLDEEGELVKFPDPIKSNTMPMPDCGTRKLSDLRLIATTAKAALAGADSDFTCYTGYYVADKVVATDSSTICGISIPILDVPSLIDGSTMDLLDVFNEESVDVSLSDNAILFQTNEADLYATLMPELEDFAIDAITGLLEQTYPSVCKVSKSQLLQLLDRLALFVGIYDKNGIYLTFTQSGVQIDSKQANSSEVIDYLESRNFKPFTCCVNIDMLRSQVKANTADALEIHYGDSRAIKLFDANVTQVIALEDDDRA